jgi:polyvinyl alcohol dehydrogenase (cytochrome)
MKATLPLTLAAMLFPPDGFFWVFVRRSDPIPALCATGQVRRLRKARATLADAVRPSKVAADNPWEGGILMKRAVILALALLGALPMPVLADEVIPPPYPAPPQAAGLYAERCSACHDHPQDRIPPRASLIALRPERVVRVLSQGVMRPQAEGLSQDDIRALAILVTGKPFSETAEPDPAANLCKADGPAKLPADNEWNGWGRDPRNTRYIANPGFTAAELPRLKVKWAFALPGHLTYGQPVIAGGRLYLNTSTELVFSLDARTGCTHWSFTPEAPVKGALTVTPIKGKTGVVFADEKGFVYGLDADSGKQLWKTKIHDHPLTHVIGNTKVYEGRIYVPITAAEELASLTPTYTCCTSRGAVAALDVDTGALLWKHYTIDKEPAPFKKDANGNDVWGPAGAGVWSAPTVDAKKKLLYIGTGNSYVPYPTDTTDSVMALDLATGTRKWVSQMQKNDDFVAGCATAPKGRCAEPPGPDYDFGTPILESLPGGKRILLAGSKSGLIWGLDPDQNGKPLWNTRVGQGSAVGGLIYGSASDGKAVYTSVADPTAKPPASPGGVSAVDIATGKLLWRTAPPPPVCSWGKQQCSAVQGAAVTAMPGAVFAGSNDGHLRAYDPKTGAIIWDFDTAARKYKAVNGVEAEGGAVGNSPQVMADGTLYVLSGYGFGSAPGNALLALTVDGR